MILSGAALAGVERAEAMKGPLLVGMFVVVPLFILAVWGIFAWRVSVNRARAARSPRGGNTPAFDGGSPGDSCGTSDGEGRNTPWELKPGSDFGGDGGGDGGGGGN